MCYVLTPPTGITIQKEKQGTYAGLTEVLKDGFSVLSLFIPTLQRPPLPSYQSTLWPADGGICPSKAAHQSGTPTSKELLHELGISFHCIS